MTRLIILSTTVLTLALLYFFVDARKTQFFPACPFHTLTNLYCPGCGSQRAVSSLLHGDLVQALSFNILLVASIPFLAYSAVVYILNIFRKQKLIQTLFYSPVFAKTVLTVVVVFWICRNIPSLPFSALAPH